MLQPGNAGSRTNLGLERLTPNRSYRVCGALEYNITTDKQGKAVIGVDLNSRKEIYVSPVE